MQLDGGGVCGARGTFISLSLLSYELETDLAVFCPFSRPNDSSKLAVPLFLHLGGLCLPSLYAYVQIRYNSHTTLLSSFSSFTTVTIDTLFSPSVLRLLILLLSLGRADLTFHDCEWDPRIHEVLIHRNDLLILC
jgi:hypothetical protein